MISKSDVKLCSVRQFVKNVIPKKFFFFVVNKKKFSPKGLESLIKGLYVSHLDCNPREIVKRFNDSFLIKRTLVKGYNPLTFSAF